MEKKEKPYSIWGKDNILIDKAYMVLKKNRIMIKKKKEAIEYG